MITRRLFLGGLAAPAIVRASSLMPIFPVKKSYLMQIIEEYPQLKYDLSGIERLEQEMRSTSKYNLVT